jgi:hypothetical protein
MPARVTYLRRAWVALLIAALAVGGFSLASAGAQGADPSEVAALALADPGPTPNNALSDDCGLDIVLVVDRSGSTAGFDTAYRNSAKAFINELVGTPSRIGIVTFSVSASTVSNYVDVSTQAGADTLNGLIDGLGAPFEGTNWEAALAQAATFAAPQLVLFVTDGNPTTQTTGGDDYDTHLGAGIAAANALKANGVTHITGVAVGENLGVENIAQTTGSGAGVGGANPDVHQSDPAALADQVRAIATELCVVPQVPQVVVPPVPEQVPPPPPEPPIVVTVVDPVPIGPRSFT